MITRWTLIATVAALSALTITLSMQNDQLRDEVADFRVRQVTPQIGDVVPTVAAVTLKGESVVFPPRRPDAPHVAYIFNTGCPHCLRSLPWVNYIAKQVNEGEDVRFTSVSRSSKESTWKYVQQHKIDYPVVMDDQTNWATAVRAGAVPTLLIIDSNSRILHVQVGAIDSREMADAILRKAIAGPKADGQ